MLFSSRKTQMIDPSQALPGRDEPMPVPARHEVLGTPLMPPFPEGLQRAVFGMGCFWGAERVFWQAEGVYTTAAGYAGGFTPNPSYAEVCSAGTGHAEVVLAVFDPNVRQGNDAGTQYRSAIYTADAAQREAAEASREMYQQRLSAAGHGEITTEIADAGPFYYAEDYHQQYLAKNPGGYCGIGGTGVSCPIGLHA